MKNDAMAESLKGIAVASMSVSPPNHAGVNDGRLPTTRPATIQPSGENVRMKGKSVCALVTCSKPMELASDSVGM